MAETPTLLDVFAARRRLASYLRPTPLRTSDWLSAVARAPVQIKVESILPTSAFKIRGALNALLVAAEQARITGAALPAIVTASAGNHGAAMSLAAERLGFTAVVFTPTDAPDAKKDAIRRHGADLRDTAPTYDDAETQAQAYAAAHQALYLSPYNHPDVIAGAGTIALEIVDELPDVDLVVIPLGGGGLASGMAIALKAAAPRITIVGVEAAASPAFSTSLAHGAITAIVPEPSLADGLTGNLEAGTMTFDLVRRHVDRVVSVSETALAQAVHGLAAHDHLLAEGAGAAAAAAVLARLAVDPGQRAVVMLTGANIDLARFISVAATAGARPGSAGSAPGGPAGRR